MVCCVQVTRLVEFLIEHHGELFEEEEQEEEEQEEEEAAGLAGASAEESPAPGAEAGTAEVCQVQKQCDNKSLPLRRWDCCRRDKQDHPPACSSAKAQSEADAGWPSRFVR